MEQVNTRFGIKFLTNPEGYSKQHYPRYDGFHDPNGELDHYFNYERVWLYGNHGKSKTLVTAGGWIGILECMAAQIYDKVYTLEPDPLLYKELCDNISINNYKNVQIDNLAFFDGSQKTVTMNRGINPNSGGSGMFLNEPEDLFTVNTITLKEYFDKNNIDKYSFLMIDVEGAEYALFDDVEFFEKYKPVILLEHHMMYLTGDRLDRFISAMNNLSHIYPTINLINYRSAEARTHRLYIPIP